MTLRGILLPFPRGHLTLSGVIFGCLNSGEDDPGTCEWRSGRLPNTLQDIGQSHDKEVSGLCVSSAEAEKLTPEIRKQEQE